MVLNIERDQNRFKQIVRGAIRRNLKRYITRGEFIGRRGRDYVSIPVPQIEIPTFRYDPRSVGGVGQGEGESGTPIGAAPGEGNGSGAGSMPGEHILEVDVQLSDLARILGEELELPRIEPRGRKNIIQEENRYIGINRVGPDSLRHFKRTYKQALKRQIISGSYSPEQPMIVPIRDDLRYRARKKVPGPTANAVIVYMMDVSGSMEDEQKEIVRIESFWIDTWLRSQYRGIESRYIVHDTDAKEVDEETFYHLRESGGTRISSAYQLAAGLIERHYPTEDWNIYLFHFSDGDNLSDGDDESCVDLITTRLLPRVNLFCYGQVEGRYGSGKFLDMLADRFEGIDRVSLSRIEGREHIFNSIKVFLGKGR
jgi:uncharacterized sporulation protein YeaH/YhbH (DUF444 family)